MTLKLNPFIQIAVGAWFGMAIGAGILNRSPGSVVSVLAYGAVFAACVLVLLLLAGEEASSKVARHAHFIGRRSARRSAFRWFKRNAAIPAFMVVALAAAAAVFQAQEVSAHSYRILQNMLKEGTPEFAAALAEATASGRVSRWDHVNLLQLYWVERDSLKVEFDAEDVEAERKGLLEALAAVRVPN